MGRLLQYIYFRLSHELAARRRSGPDLSQGYTIALMTVVNTLYSLAVVTVILAALDAPRHNEFWDRWAVPLAFGYVVAMYAGHYLAFATKRCNQMIVERLSAKPIAHWPGTLLVLAWFIGGPTSLAVAIAFR